MIRAATIDTVNFLLLPRGPAAWASRLIIWCALSNALFVIMKALTGSSIDIRQDSIVMSLTAAPFFVMALILARRWENTRSDLAKISSTDTLTGIMNRRAFFDAIEKSEDGALLLIDVDNFKAVNDRYGHTAGDAVLVALVDHLWRNLRSTDLLGRIGGEEFGVFLFGADSLQIDIIGERISSGFVFYDKTVPSPIKVTVSIGTAFSGMSTSVMELYARRDEALYQAKRSGRAKLNFWQPP